MEALVVQQLLDCQYHYILPSLLMIHFKLELRMKIQCQLHPSFFDFLKSSSPKVALVVQQQLDYLLDCNLPNLLKLHFKLMLQMMIQYQLHPSSFSFLKSSFPMEELVGLLLMGYQLDYILPMELLLMQD